MYHSGQAPQRIVSKLTKRIELVDLVYLFYFGLFG